MGGRGAAHTPTHIHLHEPVEVGRDQHRLQLFVESVTRRAWQLRPRYQHVRLPFPLPSKSHSPPAFRVRRTANQTRADFVNGLLRAVRHLDRDVLPAETVEKAVAFLTVTPRPDASDVADTSAVAC